MTFIKLPRLYSVDEFPWPNPYQEMADRMLRIGKAQKRVVITGKQTRA